MSSRARPCLSQRVVEHLLVDDVGEPAFHAPHRPHRCLAVGLLPLVIVAAFAWVADLYSGHCCIRGRPRRGAGDLPVDCRAKRSNGRPVRLRWVVLARLGRSPSARTGRFAAPGARDRSTQQCRTVYEQLDNPHGLVEIAEWESAEAQAAAVEQATATGVYAPVVELVAAPFRATRIGRPS